MLFKDAAGLDITTTSKEAVDAFNAVALGVLSHAKATSDALVDLLTLDPRSVLGWSVKSFAALMLARSELLGPARAAALEAQRSYAERGGTRREGLYMRAALLASHGEWTESLVLIEQVLAVSPQDSLAAKLSHGLRFMLGDKIGMRASIGRVLAQVDPSHPHLGFLLGCEAFSLEEMGEFERAEATGRRAVTLAPMDAWGLHAVSHVYEMTGNARAGIDWIETRPSQHAHCGNFAYHIFWHLALHRLDLNDIDGVLALYDEKIRSTSTDDFRDVANAASLLTRLELEGIDVGHRWEEVADIAETRVADGSLVFADLHYMLALAGAGRDHAGTMLCGHLSTRDPNRSVEQEVVAQAVGHDFAIAIAAFRAERFEEAAETMMRLRPSIYRAGGSDAQRDVFEQLTIEAVMRAGDLGLAERLLRERLMARSGRNPFAAKRLQRIALGRKRTERVGTLAAAMLAPHYD